MKWLGLILSCLWLTSCLESGGEVSFGTAAPGSPATASMTIEKIQGQSSSAWITDNAGKIYLNTSALAIAGRCSRGVGRISVIVNNTVDAQEASCGSQGTFIWNKFFPSSSNATGDEYTVELQGLRADGGVLPGLTTSKVIVIDTRAPTAPKMNTVSGCKLVTGVWVCSDSHIRVSGSWFDGEGVVSLQYPTSGTISYPTATTFALDLVLAEGQTRSLSFAVKDKVGNTSGISTLSVSYISLTTVLASSLSSGGTFGFSGGPVNSAPSMIMNMDSFSGRAVDQGVQLNIGPAAVGARYNNP
ncbi:MAG: hypothetical protein J7501_04425 [Bdellovibrio sp.]|nr:hypothetical protein [Bdellovibrio sp.]